MIPGQVYTGFSKLGNHISVYQCILVCDRRIKIFSRSRGIIKILVRNNRFEGLTSKEARL